MSKIEDIAYDKKLEAISEILKNKFFGILPLEIRDRVAIAGEYLLDTFTGDNAKYMNIYTDSYSTEVALYKWLESKPSEYTPGIHTDDMYCYSTEDNANYQDMACNEWQIIRNSYDSVADDSIIRKFDLTAYGIMMTNKNIFILPTFFKDVSVRRLVAVSGAPSKTAFSKAIENIKNRHFIVNLHEMRRILGMPMNDTEKLNAKDQEYNPDEVTEPFEMTDIKKLLLSKLPPKKLSHGILMVCAPDYVKDSEVSKTKLYQMHYCDYGKMLLTLKDFPNFTVDTLLEFDKSDVAYGYMHRYYYRENRYIENTQAYKDYTTFKSQKYLYKGSNET